MPQDKSAFQPAKEQTPQGYNFIDMEHKWLEHWYINGITDKYRHKNDASNEKFSFMDGPITANNPMGVHHAWGRSYKDLWQKFHNLLGQKQRFQNGFDCQGLWVEVEVEKELGLKSKKDIENLIPGYKQASIAKFVQLCKDRVLKFSEIQTQQSKRLGYFMDWDHSYYTMSAENNYMIWHFLKKCHENGWIYKGHDSVPWCPRCGTSISQHEMLTEDYSEVQHETVFFKLKIVEAPLGPSGSKESAAKGNADFDSGMPVYMLAWTTTPWTVPGNVALAVNPEINYVLISLEESQTQLILAESRLKDSIKEKYTVLKTFTGKDLLGLRYIAPFDSLERVQEAKKAHPDTFHTVVDGSEVVTETEGTGVLHVAPGQGQEDFNLGKKYGLSVIELIDEDATYYKGMGEFTGLSAKEKPGMIFKYLKEFASEGEQPGEFFYKTMSYRHRYPLCWRCKTELVWRVVDEWYIGMDIGERPLRERMKDVAKKINWIPEFGLDRELDWLDKMHDWLISKKRYWGLALPIWVTEDGKEFEVIGSEDELKERAIEGFDQLEGHTPHRPYIDAVKIKSKDGQVMTRVPDVGNVWLDAGIVPYSTITDPETGKVAYISNPEYFKEWFPIDLVTESFPGQFKNWFYSMIAMSTVLEDTNPYKNLIGYATLKAEDGRAMHKSWGNSIEFNEGADKIGVDVIRWMFARASYTDDMLFGYRKADEVRRQTYIPLWNVFKFFMEYSALDKVDCRKLQYDKAPQSANVLDRWIISRFAETTKTARDSLLNWDIRSATNAMETFVNDLSTWYLRRSRDRVWMQAESEEDKLAFYETLYYVLVNLCVILSPIMPFITEEMYTQLTGNESVHLTFWPEVGEPDMELIKDIVYVRSMVEAGHRVRKENKLKVRQPLASVTIKVIKSAKPGIQEGREQYNQLIADELNVKKVDVKMELETDTIEAEFDTTMTPELEKEGKARDLIRAIQGERKKAGVKLEQKVNITIPEEYKDFEDMVRKSVLVDSITYGPDLKIS
jgi:isoleucyl-tRNA synthetase